MPRILAKFCHSRGSGTVQPRVWTQKSFTKLLSMCSRARSPFQRSLGPCSAPASNTITSLLSVCAKPSMAPTAPWRGRRSPTRDAPGGAGIRAGPAEGEPPRQPAARPEIPRLHPPRDGGRGAKLLRVPARQARRLSGPPGRSAPGVVSPAPNSSPRRGPAISRRSILCSVTTSRGSSILRSGWSGGGKWRKLPPRKSCSRR